MKFARALLVVSLSALTGFGCGAGDSDSPCANLDPVLVDASFVLLTQPPAGSRISSPLTIEGCSRSFESTIEWSLRGRDGFLLAHGYANGGGVDGAAPFTSEVVFEVEETQLGHLEIIEPDPSDGEGFPPSRVIVPVVIAR